MSHSLTHAPGAADEEVGGGGWGGARDEREEGESHFPDGDSDLHPGRPVG